MDLEKTYDKIYRYVYFRVGDRMIAEDITQESFLRFIGKYGSLHDYEIKYLYTIARNLCIDEDRRIKPEPITDEIEDTAGTGGISEESIMVRQALDKLSEEEREIILLKHVNGENIATISKALGISRFALYRKIKNAEDRPDDKGEHKRRKGKLFCKDPCRKHILSLYSSFISRSVFVIFRNKMGI